MRNGENRGDRVYVKLYIVQWYIYNMVMVYGKC